ncbi:MAG: hypothetical protein JNL82_31400 [Myxococcales bacterium]|nr:hypothetical protein [Myxococcales bacterium]
MRRSVLALALLSPVPACDDGAAATCAEGPRRVLAPAADALDIALPTLADDRVVVAAGVPATVDIVDVCGASQSRLADASDEFTGAFALAGADGPLALGQRPGELWLIDRLDEPGVDEPTLIARVDPSDSGWYRWTDGMLLWTSVPGRDDLQRLSFYPGPEGPEAPAAPLADDAVWLARGGLDLFLALTEDGTLLRLEGGVVSVLETDVRRAGLAPDGRQFVWQARGASTTTQLRALAGGPAISLEPPGTRSGSPAADWRWTDAAVATVDASGRLLAAHDRSDGRRLAAPPPHVSVRDDAAPGGPWFFLTTAPEPDRVEVVWDPHTGEDYEWYRGPSTPLHPTHTPEGIRWLDGDPGALWLRHPAHGFAELLQPLASLDAVTLPDGRTVMRVPGEHDDRLVILSVDGRRAAALAPSVARWTVTTDDPPRLVHAAPDGPSAGVWITPL